MSSEGVRTESIDPRDAERGASLRAGELVLDRYRVERPIGRGGMGEVYEATHVTLGSRVALKLPLGKSPSGKGAARLLREAQVAASLDPERVVRVLDVGVLGDGRPVIVLERLEGETLAERIARQARLDVVEAVDFTVGACLGLAEAHARGIIHRDVKPSNLFLARRRDGSSVVKVLDFGVAALRATGDNDDARLTDSRAPVGSPPYMAPEQLRARAVDARTDVWGLGVTLFELLTGRLPFEAPSPAAISAAIVADPPSDLRELRNDVPEDLLAVVQRCLGKAPSDRPADALALARELAPFASPLERGQVQAAALRSDAPDHHNQASLATSRPVNPSRASATGTLPRSRVHPGWVALGVGAAGLVAWVTTRDAGLAGQVLHSDSEVASASGPVPAAQASTFATPEGLVVHSEPASAATTLATGSASAAASSQPLDAIAARPVVLLARPKPTAAPSAAPTASAPSPHIMDERKF